MEYCNDKDLPMEPHPLKGAVIDIDTPTPQMAITSLPDNFQIRTMSDIKTLKEFVALNYTRGIRLYRGHESHDYKIESTIVRHTKGKKKDCSDEDVLKAEKKGFNLFCRYIFKTEWLQNKSHQSDEKLFAMSIGRHLGLPCRLIDVTANLETAIWFAVMNPKFYNVDGEVVLIVLDKIMFQIQINLLSRQQNCHMPTSPSWQTLLMSCHWENNVDLCRMDILYGLMINPC